ncbi:DUF1799 domain-containing protein [Thalassospira marina]|uniref:DUF1799 domain-containing protein n=1 Tax=Thalassospira marina TaxID=2048283 RepID=A0ABN5FI39_9PROT|nr:DUF1799 domain-containing protein [Thalassospira marina]AUG53940.1 hypothetical protein CSC3H3_15350 [Thalassospira marina]
MRAWGASEDQISQWLSQQQKQNSEFAVRPENWPAVELFLVAATQWRLATNGAPYGLDYAGVELAARWAELKITPELFADLRIMEQAAIAKFAELRAR